MKRWLAAVPLALLVVLAGVALSRLTSGKPAPASFSSPARPSPAIQAPTLAGEPIDFATLKGPVIVNFWATWCTPCRAEHPVLVQLRNQGVPIIGVMHKDDPDKGQQLLAREGNPFERVALDPNGDVSLAFGISGVPESFLVDASGQIVKTLRGAMVGTEAQAFMDAYQAEVGKAATAPASPPKTGG